MAITKKVGRTLDPSKILHRKSPDQVIEAMQALKAKHPGKDLMLFFYERGSLDLHSSQIICIESGLLYRPNKGLS